MGSSQLALGSAVAASRNRITVASAQ